MRWGAKNPPKDPQASFSGKNIMITGANSGIGYHAALKFIKLGASKVILAVRTLEKGYVAKQNIEATMGEGECDRIVVMQLDMNDFGSIKQFATNLEQEVGADGLQVAILNAGVAPGTYSVVKKTGWESALQVNVLSTALLAICVIPLLKRGSERKGHPAQLTLTGSAEFISVTPEDIPVDSPSVLDALNEPESFQTRSSYLITKLLVVYVMQGLIEDYLVSAPDQPLRVAVNVVCPGYTVTGISRDLPWYLKTVMYLLNIYGGRSPEEGSRSLLSASLLGVHGHGKFWTHDSFLE
jgi:NAD(P)-dependent dehydrogenase (short-subunit alcohol dehydrogenase family)